ncbi:MAG: HTH-type transcriptional regulator MalT, partial [Pontibacterium sp.]
MKNSEILSAGLTHGLLKTSTKLRKPSLDTATVARPRLEDTLEQVHAGAVLLLQAPAGYGKSTLIHYWAQRTGITTVWYSLDASDNDPSTFIHYLAQGLTQAMELTLAEGSGSDEQQWLIQLLNVLPEEHEPVLLVLDDYHHIDHPQVNKLVQFLFQHLPSYITVALLTRTLPPLGIPELRAKGRLVELQFSDLAFDADETGAFLAEYLGYEVSREQVERLTRRTEGWASAIKLATLAGKTSHLLDAFIEQIPQGHHHIVEYLAEEVIDPLADNLKQFLYRTCILATFDNDLANQVTGNGDAAACTAQLITLGLFIDVTGFNEQGSQYRYHSLFANCLQHLLEQRHPGEIRLLHQRASKAWLQREQPSKTAEHALQAQDEGLITAILLRYGRQLYRDGQLSTLRSCLDQLSHDAICRQPLLILLQAWVAQGQHRFEEAETWLTNAESVLKPIYSEDEWRSLQGEFGAVRAQIAMNLGHTDQAVVFANQALELQPAHMRTSRTTALSVLGEVAFVNGQLDNALEQMQYTEQVARSHAASRPVIWCICQQAEIAMAKGQLQKAYNLQQKALNYSQEHQLPPSNLMEFVYRIRGQILWEWHQLEDAEKCALKGLETLEGHSERWRMQSYTILAKVALAEGKQHLCADYIKQIQKLLASWDFHMDWVSNAYATLISYWEEVRDLDTMNHWLSITPEVTEPTNHFTQCNLRNRARVLIALERYDEAETLLVNSNNVAQQLGLVLDQTRNHIFLAHLRWQQDQRDDALTHLSQALTLANTSGILSSFLRIGKPLIVMLKALQRERGLNGLEDQRAERLIRLSQQHKSFSKAIRITLDEAIIQDIINRPDVPELIRISPLTRREWQVLSLIHAGMSNEQI